MTRRTIEIPVSDCGCFAAGELGPDVFKDWPKYGIIIGYSSREAARAACRTTIEAHCTDGESSRRPDDGQTLEPPK